MTEKGFGKSPFHRGEKAIQASLDVRDRVEAIGQKIIRDHLPEQHRQFYKQLPLLFVASTDEFGRPWASVLAGRPGFASSPDPHTLNVVARPIYGDPLKQNLTPGARIGMLGIEYTTRRRNRLNGHVLHANDADFSVRANQSFGNCPQYIQSREYELMPGIDRVGEARRFRTFKALDDFSRRIVSKADNFYIATSVSVEDDDVAYGADISHRGGKPGFVRIDDEGALIVPDYPGNNHFNTLGNILLNPRAGLLFIDFTNGHVLSLTCSAEICWDVGDDRRQRFVRFTIDEGLLIEDALPIRWRFRSYSPTLEQTFEWDQAPKPVPVDYRDLRVTRIERESDVITSFYLVPGDGSPIAPHTAGQFLPIEVVLPGGSPVLRRTYTISSSPNGAHYRLSIKKERAASVRNQPGVVSSYFHDHACVGGTIRASSPRGRFTLDESNGRPVVLLSAGVGITPMISMLMQLVKSNSSRQKPRHVWFIHGASNGSTHAFNGYVREVAATRSWANVHICYSRPRLDDIEIRDHDSVGRVDIELLKSLLPLDDYDYYLCGPVPFMKSLYEGLIALNVDSSRIRYEHFGTGTSLAVATLPTGRSNELIDPAVADHSRRVRFAKSAVTAFWDSSKGSLLDLAESHGLQPAFSCRSGTCQSCAVTVVSGSVEYFQDPTILPDAGMALICSSVPAHSDSSTELVLDL